MVNYRDYSLGAMIKPVTKPFYNGWASSLEVGVIKNNQVMPIGWISGLSDEIKADWKNYKGKCVEITAMEVLETGGLRHAKLIRFRPDLSVSDCTWEKIYHE